MLEKDHEKCTNILMEAGADVNGSEYTPLATACEWGLLNGVNTLVAAGADVNERDKGETQLIKASRSCHYQCVKALIDAGADVNLSDSLGFTPLMAVFSSGW